MCEDKAPVASWKGGLYICIPALLEGNSVLSPAGVALTGAIAVFGLVIFLLLLTALLYIQELIGLSTMTRCLPFLAKVAFPYAATPRAK